MGSMRRLHRAFLSGLLLLAIGCGGGGGKDDAGGGDSGPPPPVDTAVPECLADQDCNDRMFCNGAEACVDGQCMMGDPVDCDDGDACTVDACSDALGECVYEMIDNDGDGHIDSACGGDDCDDRRRRAASRATSRSATRLNKPTRTATPPPSAAATRDGDGEVDARCCNTDARRRHGGLRQRLRRRAPRGLPGRRRGLRRPSTTTATTTIDEGVAVMGWVDDDRDLFGDPTKPGHGLPPGDRLRHQRR